MPQQRQECLVVVDDPTVRLGTFANAFRVVQGSPEEALLDFLVYSSHEGHAAVQSRVRVSLEFLQPICEALEAVLQSTKGTPRELHFLH